MNVTRTRVKTRPDGRQSELWEVDDEDGTVRGEEAPVEGFPVVAEGLVARESGVVDGADVVVVDFDRLRGLRS